MYNISEQALVSIRFRTRNNHHTNYLLILLFVSLVGFISFSIKNHITRSQFLTLIEPEDSDYKGEMLKENSVVKVRKGDNFKSILIKQGISEQEIAQITKLISTKFSSLSLKIGQIVVFDYELDIVENEYDDLASETRSLSKITIVIDNTHSIEIVREGDVFFAKNTVIPLNKFLVKSSAVIDKNFVSTLKSFNLGAALIKELVNAYSYQVDFQRQVRQGDKITVIAEQFITESGKFSHHGKVLYVSLKLSDKEYNIYNYSDNTASKQKTGEQGFFSEDGKSVRRSLLKTPINFVRISSHYGNRKHPTLGFTKLHKGVDFAAPEGTPINAAGDGVITEMGWKSGYGKFVQIKHSTNLSTAYAHASKFAKNLKIGSRVKQGQVIAYVGNTGRTTGAHLHYEVKIGGKNVNPTSIKTTPGTELSGKKLAQFQQFKSKIKALNKKLDLVSKIAATENVTASLR